MQKKKTLLKGKLTIEKVKSSHLS